MKPSVHGHDVMRMMMEANAPFTPESLESAIHRRFGEDARFHTCSADNMTARELIECLQQRNKFASTAGGFAVRADRLCDHE